MSQRTLYDTVWDRHKVEELPNGQDQLFVGLHLVHEVSSPQAFSMLRERDLEVAYPERTVAVADHIVPTAGSERKRPLGDEQAESDITYYGLDSEDQGITLAFASTQPTWTCYRRRSEVTSRVPT